jgi:RNA polymerase sigma-70 factor (ECF subfamily)
MKKKRPLFSENDPQLDFTLELTRHQAPLTAFLRSLLPVGTDPRDVLQEVNITLWKKKAHFRPGTNFKAWAFRIARYHALSHLRFLKKQNCFVFDNELVEQLADRAEEDLDPDALEQQRQALRVCIGKLRIQDQRASDHALRQPGDH